MKYILFFLGSILAFVADGQALKEINYSYQYDPKGSFSFDIKAIRQTGGWTVFYKLHLRDTSLQTDQFKIDWETRISLTEKAGTPLAPEAAGVTTIRSDIHTLTGKLTIGLSDATQVLVARVTNTTIKQLWIFFKELEPNYTENGYLQAENGEIIFEPYINMGRRFSTQGFNGAPSVIVSYFDHNFPSAAPAFSEGQARVPKVIKPDSVFSITVGQNFNLKKKGLYLVQKDTSLVEGLSFRVEDNYPKFSRLQELAGPFIYVCTKQEYDRFRLAGADKKQFDKVVISITQDAGRAKDFMKYYFQRAEAANLYFTSYKEGWKSDRGMIYLIYGEPQTVFKFFDREIWNYGKVNFNFIKSSTLFDPDNYVLIRDKKFTEAWYEKVDLIRNSRF